MCIKRPCGKSTHAMYAVRFICAMHLVCPVLAKDPSEGVPPGEADGVLGRQQRGEGVAVKRVSSCLS